MSSSDTGGVVGESQSAAPSERLGEARAASVWLWPECGQRVEPPGLDAIEVDVSGTGRGVEGGVTAHENGLAFGIVLDNQTDLVAVGIEYTLRFIGDGEDVTGQLGEDYEKHWGSDTLIVPIIDSEPFTFGDSSIEKPDGWEDMDLELDVEVTDVHHWCKYEDLDPYEG